VEGAIDCYNKALELDPDNPSVLYNKEFALYRLGSYEEAERVHSKLQSVDPDFVESLDDRGTAFFLPDTYSETLDYELPDRWYENESEEAAPVNNTTVSE